MNPHPIFLDVNVVLDFLIGRGDEAKHAALLFNSAALGKTSIHVSGNSFDILYYVIRKYSTKAKAFSLIVELEQMVEIVPVDRITIREAIHSGIEDIEDAIQNACAHRVEELRCFVTRDLKGFRKSGLPVLSPEEAVVVLGV